MPITGGCRCGALRYEIATDALPLTYACHCLDCQTWSGGSLALHAMLPAASLTIQGEALEFSLAGVETMASEHIACATCRTRVANTNSAIPGMVVLRAGTLDRSQELTPAVHIWTKRKQPWIELTDASPQFEETPSPQQFAQAVEQSYQRSR